MKQSKFLLPLFSILLLTQACTITNEGPQGPPGADGVQIYSSTSTIFADDFDIVDEFVSINEFEWDILDEATVDEGLVLGYLQFEGTTSWHALPFSTPFQDDLVNLRYVFDINSFDLLLEGEVADNNEVNEDLFDGDVLRVVAIPPSLLFKSKGLDYRNYNQVAEFYGLDDE
ncbi:MAG: hypothetical protein JJ892_02755 [Balneola sp.]|nr:hypothetical protein [Balneola sp.]MBO6650124.1 hypothetical protein [Balneola sp.]MBO6710487.1 hypothetical protein [Balneola sp.]MBO6799172.1 hypothetical protein [Balneola sp.]MBO6871012.1 hypothetical protein [Balneola sp.]